jgi:NTE family protein
VKLPGPADLSNTEPPEPRPISLALQGGGAHGAFEWGVIDRLLEHGGLEIRAVTAASAGAMNAVALLSGLAAGGPTGARDALDAFWKRVNRHGGRNVFGDSAIWSAAFSPAWLQTNPFYRSFETLMLSMSPYEFNPFNLNPLREVLRETVDFEAVRTSDLKLFVSATSVRQGRARVFANAETTPDVILASSCLPHLFQAVTIEGEPYWDGGYLANPPLWPLFYADTPDDVLLVTLNPFRREESPKTAGEIVDRLNEIAFNAPLTAELRSIAFVQKLIDEGLLTEKAEGRYRRILTHAIGADGRLNDLSLSSKFNTEWTFLNDLKQRGRAAADAWLEQGFEKVGRESSVDLKAQFL